MSTKTTFKRIALVTVAALGFGVMSTVAPASAAVAMDTLTVVDGTGSVGDSVTATSATATLSFLPSDTEDSVTVVASLVSAPAGNTVFPRVGLSETVNAYVDSVKATSGNADILGTTYDAYTNVIVAPGAAGASNTTTAKFNVWIGAAATSGAVTSGTYVVRLTPTARPTAGTATFKDITITIAAAERSSALSTARIARGVAAPDADTDLLDGLNASSAVKTAAADAIANIKVTQLKSNGTAASESITATITGAGQLGCETTQAAAAASGRALTCKTSSGVGFINVFGDGTSGKATITLKGTTSGTAYATKTVLFSGTTIAKIVATAENPVVSSTGGSATDAISAKAYDADGNQIYNPTIYLVSSAVAVLSDNYSSTCTWSAADVTTYCSVTAVAAGAANITVTNRGSAAATTPTTRVDSNAVALRVGSVTPATMALSFDKTTYLPGEKATLTLTMKDAAGNIVAGADNNTTYANVFAAGGLVSSYAFSSGDTTTAVFVKPSVVTGLKTWTVYMPLVPTEAITVYAIPGASFSAAYQAANALSTTTTVKATVAVGNAAGVDAATDAANEATDAANAATDAALAAADAADAATAAAQDASDAVAALSASVSKLISSLRAQITSLTNLVIKIQKKVRA
jgi:trimeric autotransporter adhesin